MTTDPLFMKIGSQYYFYHNDHIGTPQKMTSVSGAVVWSATYSSFGEASIEAGTIKNNLRFPGQYYDEETGLHYNYWRYYDPQLGRYLRADPIGLKGGNNLFAYGLSNPITYLDPFGLSVKICSRWVGSSQNDPTSDQNPFRHDYLNISGKYVGFFPKGDLFGSEGDVRWGNETGKGCSPVCDDKKFDDYVTKAANSYIPYYRIDATPSSYFYIFLGDRNCQTWAADVIEKAKKEYLRNEECPKCFKQ